jgi:hypothetical protein
VFDDIRKERQRPRLPKKMSSKSKIWPRENYFKILFQAKLIVLRGRYSEDSQTVIGRDCFVLLSFLAGLDC